MKTFQIEGVNKAEFMELLRLTFYDFIPQIKKELQPDDEELLNIKDTCKLLNKTRATIYNYIIKGIKPIEKPLRRGSSIYFKKSEILHYQESTTLE